jgi:RecB family exonuclease
VVLNRLTTELAKVCRERRTEETWLLAPSYRIGNQWLDAVAAAGTPSLNVRVKTLTGLAIDLAGPEMARQGLEFLPRRGAEIILGELWHAIRETVGETGYLFRLVPSPSLAAALTRTVQDLRMTGVPPDTIRAAARRDHWSLGGKTKAEELRALLSAFTELLDERRLADTPRIFELAETALGQDPGVMPPGVAVLVPEDLRVEGLGRRLLNSLPGRITLPVERMGMVPEGVATTDARLLAATGPLDLLPPPSNDGTVQLFCAAGEAFEIREGLRRCASSDLTLDQIELLHTDADTYLPLVWGEIARLFDPSPDQEFGTFGYPVTFEEGIPVSLSRPGRALSLWVSWITSGEGGEADFPQSTVTTLIREGLLAIEEARPEDIPWLARQFRSLPIGWGLDRYLPALDRALGEAEKDWPEAKEDDDELLEERNRRKEAVIRSLRILIRLVKGLRDSVPGPTEDARTVLGKARGFVERFSPGVSIIDGFARRQILDELTSLVRWAVEGGGKGMRRADWLAQLAALPGELRIGGAGPRPGCLHVSPLPWGGNSGRSHLLLLGMDDRRFPGGGTQDPILLDGQRSNLSSDMPTAARRQQEKVDGYARLLARWRGTVTIGFPAKDLSDDRTLLPSSAVLTAYRIISGKRDADFADLARHLGAPASFAPRSLNRCLDETEWWLLAMNGPRPLEGAGGAVRRRFRNLAEGERAARGRESAALTPFDGLVGPRPGLDPRSDGFPAVSPSRLETIGACPLRYFFKYVLGLSLPEEIVWDRSTWLDPLQEGSLLHELFRCFTEGLIGEGRDPDPVTDRDALLALLDRLVSEKEADVPAPSVELRNATLGRLQAAAHNFIADLCEGWEGSRPVMVETSVGGSDEDPVTLRLPDGRGVRIKGKIDRIDQEQGRRRPTFTVIDYKTGKPPETKEGDPFLGGRLLQNLVYFHLASAAVRRVHGESAVVSRFAYRCPGVKGKNRDVSWEAEAFAGGGETVAHLCDIAASGVFLPADDPKAAKCDYCDYKAICDAAGHKKEWSAGKLANVGESRLDPHRALKGDLR